MGTDDSIVAARLLERDESALRDVIETHGPAVLGMAARVIADRTRAEEVAQDTFVALWRRPGAFDPDRGTLRGFLLGVARNKAIDLVRHENSLKKAKDRLLEEQRSTPSASVMLESVEDRHSVRDALMELSDLQREALVLAYFGGRTYREVAVELGVPEGTVKTRLRDGLIKLRALLETSRETS
ncbi:MAG: sigma-70 family RNA polymerase sigma factor [Actinomycetota bacterium]|nr:sigma-70 family RNA polymerase sigma factor [Actinomycetota bacterium]